MLKKPIYISALSSISSLGSSAEEVWQSYQDKTHSFEKIKSGKEWVWVACLGPRLKDELQKLRASNTKYRHLDDTVLYAINASRKTVEEAKWGGESNFGINIGSSRGATTLFEKHHNDFLQNSSTATLASPTTTLGNISSWVAHDLKSKGPTISHSITCSTALHALLNGIAWLNGGMAEKFLVGGSEASLTPFTLAQMQALKIYSNLDGDYPCRALDFDKEQNTMVLGEAAAMASLEVGNPKKKLAEIIGVGYATEPLTHNVSISTNADCFQDSIKMALKDIDQGDVDIIIMHAPGTLKGDLSEYRAVQKVFGDQAPALTSNKFKIGHTFGASGMMSVQMAVLMMQHQQFINVPFLAGQRPKKIESILINAVGFGGNAVSILLKAPN